MLDLASQQIQLIFHVYLDQIHRPQVADYISIQVFIVMFAKLNLVYALVS